MIDETIFNQAVTITAAFIANGDIRCGGSTHMDSTAMSQVHDLITTLYPVIEAAKHQLSTSE